MNIAFTTKKDNLTVTFKNLSTAPHGTTWDWKFGDGETSTSKSPIHTYNEQGFFLVELVATYQTEDPITISSTLVITNTATTSLNGSIYTLVDQKLPGDITMSFNEKQSFIEKWQLYLQPMLEHTVPIAHYNDELYYEALENQLILDLVTYDYLVFYINGILINIDQGNNSEETSKVKRITTGPSEVEYFNDSDISIEKIKSITRYAQKGGVLDILKDSICSLSFRLNIQLPICKSKNHPVIPLIFESEIDRPLKGPNPAYPLNQ